MPPVAVDTDEVVESDEWCVYCRGFVSGTATYWGTHVTWECGTCGASEHYDVGEVGQ